MRPFPFLFVCLAAPVAACNSGTPPPLTGNLTDAHGAHAGSFRPADIGSPDENHAGGGNDTSPASSANSQDAPQ